MYSYVISNMWEHGFIRCKKLESKRIKEAIRIQSHGKDTTVRWRLRLLDLATRKSLATVAIGYPDSEWKSLQKVEEWMEMEITFLFQRNSEHVVYLAIRKLTIWLCLCSVLGTTQEQQFQMRKCNPGLNSQWLMNMEAWL